MKTRCLRLPTCISIFAIAFSCSTALAEGQTRVNRVGALAELGASIEAIVQDVDPAVVQIFTTGRVPGEGVVAGTADLLTTQRRSGSGVVVDAAGYVITSA